MAGTLQIGAIHPMASCNVHAQSIGQDLGGCNPLAEGAATEVRKQTFGSACAHIPPAVYEANPLGTLAHSHDIQKASNELSHITLPFHHSRTGTARAARRRARLLAHRC